ncbi:hypothetical protein [Sphingobacterium thalpophilum]|uniref:hypothetical protein n=1 Tax=Sphingobacterium thalpophilum TaxID=259 RepID=UPI0024A6D39D|nr:hypothetical protein [Sphingobacterium thalpophilum]
MENTREQKLKYAFGAHPSVKEFHVTSDDQMFLTAVDAKNHAHTLEDQEVKIELRSDYVTSTVKSAPENQLDLEKEALRERHKELIGKYPAANAGIETIKKNIQEAEDRLAEEVANRVATENLSDTGSAENVGDGDNAGN